jgi:hypothetical protein
MCFFQDPSPVRRVPIPNRYTAKAKLCFCKNNKRSIISDSSVAQREVLVLDNHGHLVAIVLWNVVQGGFGWDGVQTMCVDSPSTHFNLERFTGQGIEHLVVNWGNAGLGTGSIFLICVALVLSNS